MRSRTVKLLAVALLTAGFLVSCGGTETVTNCPQPDIVDTGGSSGGVDIVDITGPDTGGGGGKDIVLHNPDGVDPGEFGALCLENSDCASGWCVPFDEGFVCTERCLQTCPDGWACRGIAQTAPDLVFVCFPQNSHLCQPCVTDYECEGGFCLPVGQDGANYCTRPCGEVLGCPDGFACESMTSAESGFTADMCTPVSGRCDCTGENAGQARACSVANDFGTCWGVETCDTDAGWIGCTAAEPIAEDCNGLDDDCNGLPDDNPVEPTEPCEVSVEGLGTCSGQWFCRGLDGWYCSAPTPVPETCDYQDNDCDGETDEEFIDAAVGAYIHPQHCGGCGADCTGRFPNATATCRATDEGTAECVVESCEPGYYRANDFACLPLATSLCMACVTDANCLVPGDRCVPLGGAYFCGRDCGADSIYGEECPEGYECQAPFAAEPDVRQCVPMTGSCDCTEANAGAERSCTATNQDGTCFGLQVCDPATGWTPCDAEIPAAETCDGLDNDCDGLVDESLVPPPEACANTWTDPDTGEVASCGGTWACRREGDVTDWACVAPEAGPEICDYRDNDCDGDTDEGFRDGDGLYSNVDNCGVCGYSCTGSIPFAAEVDCDASGATAHCIAVQCEDGYYRPEGNDAACIPEGEVADCTPCGDDIQCEALPGTCARFDGGRYCLRSCSGPDDCPEGYACDGERCEPTTGSCSCRLDGDVGSLRPCFTSNDFGDCPGTQACELGSGWSSCSAPAPARELCDGIDNDCNGFIDDELTPPAAVCEETNVYGTCQGDWVCGPQDDRTTWFCTALVPSEELCDYQDNDCDDEVDELFREEGSGLYNHPQHCGACFNTCDGRIPNATATCSTEGGAAHCVVVECDPGYYSVSDLACLPITDDTCRPCESDDECPIPGDVCLRLDDGMYCGRDCSEGNQHGTPAGFCPDGFVCGDFGGGVRQCSPASGSCSCQPGDEGTTRTCVNENDFGACFGRQTCHPAVGWSTCTARTPSRDICNGLDDDCNGRADDAPEMGEDCIAVASWGGETYSCSGHITCIDGIEEPSCSAPTPVPETCNYHDDDCDGEQDEDWPELYGTCSQGTGGCRRFGYIECTTNGQGVKCSASAGDAEPEICNGVDDNCDGETDEDWPDVGAVCVNGQGICERFGIFQCDIENPSGVACDVVAGEGNEQEHCDYLDDDCDGETDEEWPELGTVCVVGDGICERAGVYRCDADNPLGAAVCSAEPGDGNQIEHCDYLDDDCDGETDEDWPELGNPCTVGEGLCERTGIWVCNLDAPLAGPMCNATPGEPIGAETCDYLDDDCDGQVDEGFVDDRGNYTSIENCGACEHNCNDYWVPTAAVYNLTPFCDTFAPYPTCSFICLNGFVDADGIPENGCELEIDLGAVYVQTPTNGGEDNARCGTYDQACATIGFGIERAIEESKTRVLVSDGVYTEQVVLQAGVSVLGGYNHLNWQRDWTVNLTVIQGNPYAQGIHKRVVVAEDINTGTARFEGFTVQGLGNFFPSGNSYAVYVRDCNASLEIANNVIYGANGALGQPGGDGASGESGAPGIVGIDAHGAAASTCYGDPADGFSGFAGGGGGVRQCLDPGAGGPMTEVSGGSGGWTTCPQRDRVANDGEAADGQPGLGVVGQPVGAGGDGGWDTSSSSSGCYVSSHTDFHMPGYDGLDGTAGTSGTGGAGATDGMGGLLGFDWAGQMGSTGVHGSHGSGGGGGGGGAGCDRSGTSSDDFGATGGGGGSGGCAGVAASGGTAGGGSFGIFVIYTLTTPAGNADVPVIVDNTLWRGLGGNGGYGGNGGGGGDGGPGALGGAVGTVYHRVFCVGVGGTGGSGGRGGHGGGGGGGAGGASFDIAVWGSGAAAPTYVDDNDFLLDDTVWTGGQGGSGGNSPNTTTGLGGEGITGTSGRVHLAP